MVEPTCTHERIRRDDLVSARRLPYAVDDKEPNGGFHGHHSRGDAPVAQTLNDSFNGVLVLIPRSDIAANLQGFAYGRFLKCRRYDDDLTANGNDRERDALGTTPPYSGEVVERRPGFDEKRLDFALTHEHLKLGDAGAPLLDRDRFRVSRHGFQFRPKCGGQPVPRGDCDQGSAGGAAKKNASRYHCYPFFERWFKYSRHGIQ